MNNKRLWYIINLLILLYITPGDINSRSLENFVIFKKTIIYIYIYIYIYTLYIYTHTHIHTHTHMHITMDYEILTYTISVFPFLFSENQDRIIFKII